MQKGTQTFTRVTNQIYIFFFLVLIDKKQKSNVSLGTTCE